MWEQYNFEWWGWGGAAEDSERDKHYQISHPGLEIKGPDFRVVMWTGAKPRS